MKSATSVLMFLFTMTCMSQTIPENTYYVKKVISTEYNNGDTINNRVVYTFFDSTKNVLTNENTLESALNKGAKTVVIHNSKQKNIRAHISPKGDTTSLTIYLYDKNGNRTHNVQIGNGDTLNAQKRVYDEAGNCIKLFNKDTNDYYLSMEWKYDSHNNYTESKTYNNKNQLIELKKYQNKYSSNGKKVSINVSTYENGRGFVKYYKSVKKGNIKKTYLYYNQIGYNYGILLKTVDGGYRIEEFFEDENLKRLELYDKNKNLTASVYVTWEILK